MSIDWGFDFRNTLGFVSDPANCSFDNGLTYPNVYSNGATAGWTDLATQQFFIDTDATLDPRLAGLASNANAPATKMTFQVDLPSTGTYTIVAGAGDKVYDRPNQTWVMKDGGVAFDTMTDLDAGGGTYLDASHVLRTSSADWVTNNASITHNFTSTTFTIVIGDGVNATFLNHLRITGPSGGSVAPGEDDAVWIMPIAVA